MPIRQHGRVPRVEVFRDADTPASVLSAAREMVFAAFEGGFSDDDWAHGAGGWRVVVRDGDDVLSHGAVVPRSLWVGDRELRCGYVEAVATAPGARRHGHGSSVMVEIDGLVREHFELGGLSTSRRDFYARLGWESWAGPSWVLNGDSLTRTPDEDDGLMVLRCGPSAEIDLGDSITCRSRAGDDW